MRKRSMQFAITAVLSLGALIAQTPPPPAQGENQRPMARRDQKFEQIANLLELTESQRAQAKQLQQVVRNDMQQIRPQLRTAHQSLEQAIKANNSEQISAAASEIGTLTGRIVAAHAQAVSTFYGTLTPEQQKKAEILWNVMGPGRWHKGPRGSQGLGPHGPRP